MNAAMKGCDWLIKQDVTKKSGGPPLYLRPTGALEMGVAAAIFCRQINRSIFSNGVSPAAKFIHRPDEFCLFRQCTRPVPGRGIGNLPALVWFEVMVQRLELRRSVLDLISWRSQTP